jgi:ABC-type transporter Mla subunit MlaD
MRRLVFLTFGILELVIAGILVYLGFSLPRPSEIGTGFDRAEKTARGASRQVGALRRQVVEVRRPEMLQLAERIQSQTDNVTSTLKKQRVDYETVASLRTSLADVAMGLEGIAETLDPDRIGRLGSGLGETARYLDESVLPISGKAADQLDELAESLGKDGEKLTTLLKEATPDLKAAREVHDSLGRFNDGLEKMLKLLELKRLDAIKDGFSGLETSLSTTAGEVERLSGHTYPKVKVSGLKVEVEEKPFWPNGAKVAEGLRKATDGVRAARKELGDVGSDLPELRKSLEESRKIVAQTRAALGQALKQQDQMESLLRDMPARTAKVAQDLPKLGRLFARLLRDTDRLRELSASLRQAQKGIDNAVAHWPDLRKSLRQSANLLKASSAQLEKALQNRNEYELTVKESTELADTFAHMAPLFVEQVTTQLSEQEHSLSDLERSLDEVGDTIPPLRRSAVDVITAGRLLAWLMALVVGLHGGFTISDQIRGSSNRISV